MKIEWLVDDVTAVGSPNGAERAIWGVILGVFWSIQAIFVVEEPLCDVRVPTCALTTQRGTCYFGDGFGLFWPLRATFVVRELLCNIRTPS